MGSSEIEKELDKSVVQPHIRIQISQIVSTVCNMEDGYAVETDLPQSLRFGKFGLKITRTGTIEF